MKKIVKEISPAMGMSVIASTRPKDKDEASKTKADKKEADKGDIVEAYFATCASLGIEPDEKTFENIAESLGGIVDKAKKWYWRRALKNSALQGALDILIAVVAEFEQNGEKADRKDQAILEIAKQTIKNLRAIITYVYDESQSSVTRVQMK